MSALFEETRAAASGIREHATALFDIFDDEQALFRLLLDAIPAGILAADTAGVIRFVNRGYARQMGVSEEALTGRLLIELFPEASACPEALGGSDAEEYGWKVSGKGTERFSSVRQTPLVRDGLVAGSLVIALPVSGAGAEADVGGVSSLMRQVASLARRKKTAPTLRYSLQSILGGSQPVADLRERIVGYARTDLPVLIVGGTGTGKELAANAIHTESARSGGPFISINCAAVPKELFESELFGFAPGAFSGAHKDGKAGLLELADKGTLFLDEIGDAPLSVQAKLLRVLEERSLYRVGATAPYSVDFRLVTATNRDLRKMIAEGAFREDLYYRISPASIRMPSLAERKEDIPLLIAHFLRRMGKPSLSITDSALEVLSAHSWPGNVRELRNVVLRAASLCNDAVIDMELLSKALEEGAPVSPGGEAEAFSVPSGGHAGAGSGQGLQATLAGSELRLITLTLQEQGWNMTRAAKKLGISRATLYEKMKKHGLTRDACIARAK